MPQNIFLGFIGKIYTDLKVFYDIMLKNNQEVTYEQRKTKEKLGKNCNDCSGNSTGSRIYQGVHGRRWHTVAKVGTTQMIRLISIQELEGVSIGHAQSDEAKTGVSVIYFPHGAQVGCDISGGGPASRENLLAEPMTADNPIDAIVFSGGSAYGLAASDGVVRCLQEHGIGYDTGYAKIPLVCQSCIYDLGYGSSDIRPDAQMGFKACSNAIQDCDTQSGSIGAGAGATVGKLCGMKQSSKGGLGIHAIQVGELKIAAIVVVNAFGDIFCEGKKIAGTWDSQRESFLDTTEALIQMLDKPRDLFQSNTTIGCIITNAKFDKTKLSKVASMARNGYARAIDPVGTMADGDSIYACSVGEVVSDINLVGTLSAKVMESAIHKAIEASKIDDNTFLQNCRDIEER